MSKKQIFQFAYLPDYGQKIEALISLARPERWDYVHDHQDFSHQILRNYVNHTFMRLCELNKKDPTAGYIHENDTEFCFDTGLFTKNFEPIYAFFLLNDSRYSQKWALKGFYKKSERELRKIAQLPLRATYFDDFEDLIYDTRIDLRINIDHILDDERNKERIPNMYRALPNLPMLFLGSGNTNLYHALKLQDKGHSPVIICITKGGANAPPFHNRSSFRIVLS